MIFTFFFEKNKYFYFEDWLDVGEWRGGGVEHSDEDNEQ